MHKNNNKKANNEFSSMVKSCTNPRKSSMLQKIYFDISSPTTDGEEVENIDVQDDVNEDVSWVTVVKKVAGKTKTVNNNVKPGPKSVGTGIGANTAKGLKIVRKSTVDIGAVTPESKSRLRKAGQGKITIDSGAGEGVCPLDLLPEEPLHATSKNGTRYRAAGGQSLINHGEKRVKFSAGEHVGKMSFQAVSEVKKPLASAAKIANEGNIIVLDEEGGDSYIFNKLTEKSIPMRQENNVYVLDVEYMVESDASPGSPFPRLV